METCAIRVAKLSLLACCSALVCGGITMQQRKSHSTSGRPEVEPELELKASPFKRMLPCLALLLLIPGYCLYLGRQEVFDAVGGARAYISTSLWNKVSDTPVVVPGDLAQKPISAASLTAVTAHKEVRLPKKRIDVPRVEADPAPVTTHTTVITEITLNNGTKMQILDEPIPEDCSPEPHSDYDGYAVQWGLGNKARSAAECCRRCKEFKPEPNVPHGCNIWVWCGDPSGVCWTMDVHNHTTGDCWLKYQAGWDGNTDRKTTNLKVNHRHSFSQAFRTEHNSAPELIPWMAGLIPPPKTS